MSITRGADVPDNHVPRVAMRTAFWSWTVIIVTGLVVMIALPLVGR
ncbi:hypothetical protein ACNPNP_12920 [Microbacterium sp. AGC85]